MGTKSAKERVDHTVDRLSKNVPDDMFDSLIIFVPSEGDMFCM